MIVKNKKYIVGNEKYPELVCVRAVEPRAGLAVYVTFTDGSAREIDLEPYLHGPIFDPIRNDPYLFASVYVDPETETLTWPNGADIAPETLYYDGNPPWATEEPVTRRRPRAASKPRSRTSVKRSPRAAAKT